MAKNLGNKNAVAKDLLAKMLSRLVSADSCWRYGPNEPTGYARVRHDGKRDMAHRAVYEILVGEIPEGLQLDHLCRNRDCVNPSHLEPVTIKQNLLRSNLTIASQNKSKTHCKNGHEFNSQNTYVPPKRPTRRYCKTCQNGRVAISLS